MISNIATLLAAVVLAQGQTPPPASGPVKVDRVYTKGSVDKYAVQVNLNMGGAEGKATASIESKVVDDPKDGSATVEMVVKSIAMAMGDQDMPTEAPDAFKSKFDKTGLPIQMDVKNERWVYGLTVLAGYAPGATEIGKEFKINWKSNDGNLSISGTGKVVEVVSSEGGKVAVVKTKVGVSPSDDAAGIIEVTSRLDLVTGKLVEASGKLEIEGDGLSATFTVKRAKA